MFGGCRRDGIVGKSRTGQWPLKAMLFEGKRDRWGGIASSWNERIESQDRDVDYIPPVFGCRNEKHVYFRC